jgi:hypothetical protein
MCESGIWTTRTKNIAQKLLEMKSGNYILFCDTKSNALNNLQYLSESNEVIDNVLTNIGANNFCILKVGNRTIGGVALNKDIETIPNGINIFKVTSCANGLADDGQYHACDGSNKVWYNKRIKSLIYSQNAISVPNSAATEQSRGIIANIIRPIVNTIRSIVSPPTLDTYYVDRLKKFNRLYLSEQNGRTISGIVEGPSSKNIVISYSGFTTNICSYINQYNADNKDLVSGITCNSQGNTYYALAQGSSLTNVNPDKIWPDLTSKMRLR